MEFQQAEDLSKLGERKFLLLVCILYMAMVDHGRTYSFAPYALAAAPALGRARQSRGTRIPKFDNGRIIGSMSTFTIGGECSMQQLAILEMGLPTLNKNRQEG